ncbi:MAG: hypothetical protein ACFE9Q_03160 [Candidatus Hodarchaeota archaeon]
MSFIPFLIYADILKEFYENKKVVISKQQLAIDLKVWLENSRFNNRSRIIINNKIKNYGLENIDLEYSV